MIPKGAVAWLLCMVATCPPRLPFPCHGKTRPNTLFRHFWCEPSLQQGAICIYDEISLKKKKINPLCTETIPLPITSGAADEDRAPPWCSTSGGAGIAFGLGWRMPRPYPLLQPLAGSRWQRISHFPSSQA